MRERERERRERERERERGEERFVVFDVSVPARTQCQLRMNHKPPECK